MSEATKPDNPQDTLFVQLECHGDKIDVAVKNSATTSPVKRSINPKDQKINERVVALSVSQLIAVAGRDETQTRDSNEEQDSSEVEQVVEPPSSIEEERPQSRELDLFLTGAGKLRSGKSLPVGCVGLKSDLLFTSTFGAAIILEFETGATARDAGTVRTMAFLGGVGAVGRFFRGRLFFLDIGVEALLGYAYLRASPRLWALGKSAGGMTGEFVVLAAPTLVLKRALVSLHLKGGYTVANPVGYIAGEKDVTIGGFWAGVGLGLGLRIGSGT